MGLGQDGTGPSRTVRVPAKINLFLAVRGSRSDGYHDVVTVLQTISLYDTVVVGLVGPPGRAQHPATRRRMVVELRHPQLDGLPEGADNLAVRAAELLGQSAGVFDHTELAPADGPRTVIELEKDIPVGAGMAGGSADAAGALLGLNDLWDCDLDRDELRRLAADLGSDVPFCVVGGTALATGRGSRFAQVLCRGRFHWVICVDAEPLATAEVYRAWDRHCTPSTVEPDAVLQALRSRDPVALGAALHNDLEAAAHRLRPALARARRDLFDAGATGVILSGSGPTLLALAEDENAAAGIAEAVRERFAAVRVAHSPAGGPEVGNHQRLQ